jgi:hypothetical protein
MAWTDIPDSDVDPNSPLKTGLFSKLRDNLKILREGPWRFTTAEVVQTPAGAATYQNYLTVPHYVPPYAKKLVIALQVKTASGTATFQARVAGAAEVSDEPTSTSAAYERKEMTFADLSGHRGAIKDFEIWVKSTVPASTGIKGDGLTTRFEDS